MKKVKADEIAISKSPQPNTQKILQKKERKSKAIDQMMQPEREAEREHNDSFEKYYNKDLDLEEDQVPVVIYELCESAINFISQESYEKGLILLQKAQTMLEQIQAQNNPHDQFVYLLIFHNMALCYQKLGVLDECAACLDKCLNYLKTPEIAEFFADPYNPSLKLKLLKYQCKTHMQICALFSQIHKHRDAAFHANEAISIAHYLIHDSENMCAYYTKELIQNKPLAEVSIIGNLHFGLIQKTAVKLLPVFQAILKRVAIEDESPFEEGGVPITGPLPKTHHSLTSGLNKRLDRKTVVKMAQEKSNLRIGSGNLGLDVGDPDMKNILGYLNQNEWIYSLNIGNIMQVAPLTLQDFLSSNALPVELTREYVLEKICFLCVSYFCLGTEFRFLHQQNEVIQGVSFARKDSEYWHGKAVELAITFLPSESPLVSHVIMSYEKHHSPSNLPIPEDSQQDVKVRVVRQLTGVESNRLQPIIRYHPDTDYRVKFIDIKAMDYYEIFGRMRGRDVSSRRARNSDVRQSSTSLNRQQQVMRRSIQSSQGTSSKQSHQREKIFKQTGQPAIAHEEEPKQSLVDVSDDFSKQALTGVISPISDEVASNLIKMEEQRAKTQHKSPKKPSQGREKEFVDAEINAKDRQRQSELGLNQKHRKLQTSDLQKILSGARQIEHSSQIELPLRDQQNIDLQLNTNDSQHKYIQERRTRSSLSNRHISQKQNSMPMSPDEEQQMFQPVEGTLSSNLLAFNANQQRLTLNQESASSKNQRLIVEQLEEQSRGGSGQQSRQQRVSSSHRRKDDQENTNDDLTEISNQIRNSRTELTHQRSNTVGTTIDLQKRQMQGESNRSKNAQQAPITDVRTKRQSSSTIPASSQNQMELQDDLNRQSAQLVPNLNQNTRQKKMQDKANIASHLNQQMLLQHMMQQNPLSLVQPQSGSRGSQNQLAHMYNQAQTNLSATQKVSTSASDQRVPKQRRAGNSGGKQKQQLLQKQQQNSVLTNEQLVFMMQQKRDRLNQSQLVGSSATNHQRQTMQEDLQQSTQGKDSHNSAAGHIVNLNKLYGSQHRKTPTAETASQQLVAQQQAAKYQTTQPPPAQHLIPSTTGTAKSQKSNQPSVKQALLGQEHKRASSQLGSNQIPTFLVGNDDGQKQQGLPYNRKSSMEGRIGMSHYQPTQSVSATHASQHSSHVQQQQQQSEVKVTASAQANIKNSRR